jgi:pyruvate dehydrogenase E1 component
MSDAEQVEVDIEETQEWLGALSSVVKYEGNDRAQFILTQLLNHAEALGISAAAGINTPYINTISEQNETAMPDDGELLEKITNIMRWNAMAMVMYGGKVDSSLGGHIASYAGAATLYEIGFNYFFHAENKEKDHGGDLIYIQGHSSPGIYARAYVEGRLTQEQLKHFRREVYGKGISSYPHPWLMPDFWQFPTVSMGLGPIMSIYQAQFFTLPRTTRAC